MVQNLRDDEGLWNMTQDFLDWARDSNAICGMTLDQILEQEPDINLKIIAAAYFNAPCNNSVAVR